jgi:hypothetical protein
MQDPVLTSFEEIRVEVVTLRLVVRAMLAYLACVKSDSSERTLTEICGLLEGTGPYAVSAPNLDEELRQAAIARARNEMTDLVLGIRRLPIAPA